MRLALDVPEAKRRRAGLELARALSLPVRLAVQLAARRELLLTFDEARAQPLVATLVALGATATLQPGGGNACPSHPALGTLDRCLECGAPVCVGCELSNRGRLCRACFERRRRKARNRNLRVAFLLVVLAGVALYGWQRTRRRALRNTWNGPLAVSVVLVSRQPPAPAVVEAWRSGLSRLEQWLQAEFVRSNPDPRLTMINLSLAGPVTVAEPLPMPEPDAPLAQRASEALAFESAAAAIDAKAGLRAPAVVIDVWLAPKGSASFVEGLGEAGGVRGLVHGNLEDAEIDLELIAVAHELMHCLGASDKYGADGHPLDDGLAEPEQVPRFPQRFAELMAVERATAAGAGVLPRDLSGVRIGPVTAREIGWRGVSGRVEPRR